MITKKMYEDLMFFTVCNSASSLGKFFNDVVSVSSVKTEFLSEGELKNKGEVFSKVLFNEGKIGEILILMDEKDGLEFAKYGVEKKLNRVSNNDWDDFHVNVIEEMINILAGNMTEILSVIKKEEVEIDAPEVHFSYADAKLSSNDSGEYILSTFVIRLGNEKKIFIKEAASKEFYEDLIKVLKIRI